ncbi:MAG: ATP-binding protein, partial [Ignavibacteriae bacterium]|nr:ATP-binding protein [Ignavibacteriota bacterium]
ISIESIEFGLKKLIGEIKRTFTGKANKKKLEFNVQADENIHDVVFGDPVRLNQVLGNLIDNALKFTLEGKVELTVEKVEDKEKESLVKFSVKDTGIGIEKNKLEKIFESFTQAYTDTTRKFGGTGLGLAISRKLVDLQGGKLEVESRSGKGSVFFFSIWFRKSSKKIIEDFAREENLIDLSGVRMLIVEDNIMNQFFIVQLLKKWSVDFDVAVNGREAIEIMEKKEYDIVFLDLQMPVMNGFQAAEIIRDRNSGVLNHDVPLIALTADISEDTKKEVTEKGMDDVIIKPFEQKEMLAKIFKYSQKSSS